MPCASRAEGTQGRRAGRQQAGERAAADGARRATRQLIAMPHYRHDDDATTIYDSRPAMTPKTRQAQLALPF